MRRAALIAAIVLSVAWGSVGRAAAAGIYDGVWAVTITGGGQLATFYSSLNQNDNFLPAGFNIVLLSVRPGHAWGAATGTLVGQTASGTLYDDTPVPDGTFNVTFTDNLHFGGTGTLNGSPITISGVKVY